jgi:YD repeat-containing protein
MKPSIGIFRVVAGLILLFMAQPAGAQQVCYAYDGLGRLIAVMDPQGRAAIYDYDPVGNILAIRRQDATGPVTIILVNPAAFGHGAQVEIFGTGFSDIAAQDQVTIGGASATIVAASRCGVTVEVPSGATSGSIVATTPFGSATATASLADLVIPVTETVLLSGASEQFTASLIGCSDSRVIWSVNGLIGGDPTDGTITSAGVYTAPAVVSTPTVITIRAESVGCPGLSGETAITLVSEPTAFAVAAVSVGFGEPPPDNVAAPALSVTFGEPPPGNVAAPAVSVANGP